MTAVSRMHDTVYSMSIVYGVNVYHTLEPAWEHWPSIIKFPYSHTLASFPVKIPSTQLGSKCMHTKGNHYYINSTNAITNVSSIFLL